MRASVAFNETKCQQHVRDFQQLTYSLEGRVVTRTLFSHSCPTIECDYNLKANTSFLGSATLQKWLEDHPVPVKTVDEDEEGSLHQQAVKAGYED